MIEYFAGVDADCVTIRIDKPCELYKALDTLYTQMINRLENEDVCIGVLETAMEALIAGGFGPVEFQEAD